MADFFKRNAGLFTQRAPGTKQAPANPLAMQPVIGGLGGGAPGGGPMGAPMPPQAGAPGTPPIGGYDEPGSLLQFVDPQQTGQAPMGGGGLNDMATRAASLMPFGQAAAGATGGMGFTGGGAGSDEWEWGAGDEAPSGSGWGPTGSGWDTPRPAPPVMGGGQDTGVPNTGQTYAGQGEGGGAAGDYLQEIKDSLGEGSFDPIQEGIERQRDQAARNMFEGMAGRGMSQSGVQAGMAGDVYQKGWQDIAQARTEYQKQRVQQQMGLLAMQYQDQWRSLDREQQVIMANLLMNNEYELAERLLKLQNAQPGEIEGLGDDILESLKFWKWKFW